MYGCDSPVSSTLSFSRTASCRTDDGHVVFWKAWSRLKIVPLANWPWWFKKQKRAVVKLTIQLGQWCWARIFQHSCLRISAPPNCSWPLLGYHWPWTGDPSRTKVGFPCWSILKSKVGKHVTKYKALESMDQRGNLFFYVSRRDCESGEYPAITSEVPQSRLPERIA